MRKLMTLVDPVLSNNSNNYHISMNYEHSKTGLNNRNFDKILSDHTLFSICKIYFMEVLIMTYL